MPLAVPAGGPFRLDLAEVTSWRGTMLRAMRPMAERIMRFPRLNEIYRHIHSQDDPRHFSDRALSALGIDIAVSDLDFARLPATGPVVLVANHPFGGVDGLAVMALMRRVRPDSRTLSNHLVGMIPDLREIQIQVDVYDGLSAQRRNVLAMREAIQWLRDGHMLMTFPAGEVAHFSMKHRAVQESEWNDSVGRLVIKTRCPVIPIHIDGKNSMMFHAAGLIHPLLRTALLPNEMLLRQNQPVHVRIGSPISQTQLDRHSNARELTNYLRSRVELLDPSLCSQRTSVSMSGRSDASLPTDKAPIDPVPVIDAVDPQAMAAEIGALPESCHLLKHNALHVYAARTPQIPMVLRELSRLREISFRQVGEGTGNAQDLDEFDEHYVHLFVWSEASSAVLGAYRLGPTDEIMPRRGKDGLYTSTLFEYNDRLLQQISPGLEMGRSFVNPEVQRSYAPLMLLWKGIGRYIVAHPRYRYLFGPVSISSEYSSTSRQLLMAFLQMNRFLPDLAKLLKPRNPPRDRPIAPTTLKHLGRVVEDLDEVDQLVRDIEADGKPIPILLRQYLGLNAVLLGFNVDPVFGDVLDGLMLVDLLKVNKQVMKRYLGLQDATDYYTFHGRTL